MAPSKVKRGYSNGEEEEPPRKRHRPLTDELTRPAETLHYLPPNVMYVPADILDTLMRKITSGEAIAREDVSRLLPDNVAARDSMVPIYVHPKDCLRDFSVIEFFATRVEIGMWCWLVKRLLRECGTVPVARMITNARRVFLHLAKAKKHRLDQLPA